MLMGIVVKNAIVLVDYTKQQSARGMTLNEAIVTEANTPKAGAYDESYHHIRHAPVGPFQGEEGSEIWNALGITVIGRLLVSGLVTLILVPLVYSLVHRDRME